MAILDASNSNQGTDTKRSGLRFEGGYSHKLRRYTVVAIVALLTCLIQAAPCSGQVSLRGELHDLVNSEDEAFLLSEIHRIQPAVAIRRLAEFQRSQDTMGGAFCGLLPSQLTDVYALALPIDERGELEAAIAIARQRRINERALMDLGFPIVFSEGELPKTAQRPPENMHLTIDWTVPVAFLDALDDGAITADEELQIARLPANLELIRYCRSCHGLSGRPLTENDLTFFITRAGSSSPLDRLWCWLNPMNHFGYADLVVNAKQYRHILDELELHSDEIAGAVLARVAPFLPPDTEIHETVALSICCPMFSEWATPRMASVNVEHLKLGWEHMIRALSAAVIRRLQLQPCSTPSGGTPVTIDDLVFDGATDPQYPQVQQLIWTAVYEGSAKYVAEPEMRPGEQTDIDRGVALIEDSVAVATDRNANASLDRSVLRHPAAWRPLCAFGRHMARVITESYGPQEMLDLVQQGPAAFIERAAEIESEHGQDLLSREAMAAIRTLAKAS